MNRRRNGETINGSLNFFRKVSGGSSGTSASSPGKVKGDPYTALGTERPVSSFGVALKLEREPV